ncbi:MAG: cation transporter [Anaerolineae bacterium]|nr:cation transporter [Anaerolineae bacterium]
MDAQQRERKSLKAVNVGLAANIFLAGLKTGVGVIGHSPALLADGVNSTSDVAYYVVVSVFFRLARKPPDKEHPYGHHQLESIAALIVGAFVITTAIAVFWTAINDIYDLLLGQSDFSGASRWALWVALLTILIKLGLTLFTGRIGRQTNNVVVQALTSDHRNDIYSALAAAIGIFLGQMGLLWIDPLAGALVALVILRTGIEILRDASTDLMDTVPGQTLVQQVKVLLKTVPEVKQVEEIHAHRFGPYLVINLTICVDGALSVAEGDCIACEVEDTLYQNVDFLRRVYVHYHPLKSAQVQPGSSLVHHPV